MKEHIHILQIQGRSQDFSKKRGGFTLCQSEGTHQIVLSFSPLVVEFLLKEGGRGSWAPQDPPPPHPGYAPEINICCIYWLPIEQKIIFKINLITFKCLNNLAPPYLKELLTLYRPNRTLRSSSDKLRLVTVPYNLKTYGYRSYSVQAPILWNSLPFHIRSADSINSFKSKLKTYVFTSAYNL